MQRVVRGFLARCYVKTLYEELAFQDKMYDAAAKIQATYRMHRAIEQFRDLQILQLASIQVRVEGRGCRPACLYPRFPFCLRFNVCGAAGLDANGLLAARLGRVWSLVQSV